MGAGWLVQDPPVAVAKVAPCPPPMHVYTGAVTKTEAKVPRQPLTRKSLVLCRPGGRAQTGHRGRVPSAGPRSDPVATVCPPRTEALTGALHLQD